MIDYSQELSFSEISSLLRNLDWEALQQTHYRIRKGWIAESMASYHELIDTNGRNLRAYFEGSSWLQADSQQPSLIWALVYLSEYYIETKLWHEWLALLQKCFERYVGTTLSVDSIDNLRMLVISANPPNPSELLSRLVSMVGWAIVNTKFYSLRAVTDAQLEFLAQNQLGDFEKGLHYILLTYTTRKLRQRELSLHYGEQAIQALQTNIEPYHAVRARIMFASVYDYFKDYRANYSDIALAYYAQVEALITTTIPQLSPKKPYYSQGWTFIEINQPMKAVNRFELGMIATKETGLEIEHARNQYGLASALMQLAREETIVKKILRMLQKKPATKVPNREDNLRMALEHLEQARLVFGIRTASRDISPLMMVVCLHTEAIIYENFSIYEDNLAKALLKAQKGFEWLKLYVDDPVQKHNITRRLAKLYFKKKKWIRAGFYYLWDISIILKISKFR